MHGWALEFEKYPSPLATLHTPSAYLLVFHGSRDRRPREAAEKLSAYFSWRIQHLPPAPPISTRMTQTAAGYLVNNQPDNQSPDELPDQLPQNNGFAISTLNPPVVGIASLECVSESLHAQIIRFSQPLQARGASVVRCEPVRVQVLPLFLLRGMHVMEDIPREVDLAQQALGTGVQLEITPHLGSHPGLRRLISERMAALPVEAWILLAHGSRRPGANQSVEVLAEWLGAIPAYWSVPPSLDNCLRDLVNSGTKRIALFPYFLFEGSVTDAIARQVADLSLAFPLLELHLTSPLDATPELADLLVDLAGGKGTDSG